MFFTQKIIVLTTMAAVLAACTPSQQAVVSSSTQPVSTSVETRRQPAPDAAAQQAIFNRCAKLAEMSADKPYMMPQMAAPSKPSVAVAAETAAPAVAMMGLVAPHSFGAVSAQSRVVMPPVANTENYGKIDPNPVHAVAQNPVSTFSVDVDTGSYANTRRFLTHEKRLPPTDAVRVEEMVNYFDYAYAHPNDDKPFAVHTEVVDSPWHADAKLLRIGIKAQDIAAQQLPASHLVFLVDTSGSMYDRDKLPLVKQTLCILTEQLRPEKDKVTLITYAGAEKLVLSASSDKDKILAALRELNAEGSTNGESAIQMAYREAQKHFVPNGINRILLATDGDFNVGITDFNALKDLAAEKRKTGVSLTTLGYGTGNYDEELMEQLADAGDGNYSYIDTPAEAQKVLARQLSSTLATVAQDVKIQVEFNPATVKEYRLVGYENRMLKQEDFNNDKVDAGDIGAGHSVTAIYEIVPVGKQGWLNESRYQTPTKSAGSLHEYGFVKLRYKLPQTSNSLLLERAIAVGSKPLAQASNDTQWAVAVAAYGQQLQGGKYNGNMNWTDIVSLAQANVQPDPHGLRREFVELVRQAQQLSSSAQ